MKRLLVTGATGFIGAHCLPLLLDADYDEIHVVSRTGRRPNTDRLISHAVDLRVDAEATQIVKLVRPTHLLHAAWVATPGVYVSSEENLDWMQATVALVRAFAAQGGQRFVGVGTSAEYANSGDACEEDQTPLQPISLYGKAKHATWCAVQAIAQHHNIQAAWARLFLPYGPGDAPARLIPTAIAALRRRKPLPLSHGLQQRDFVYAPDAAKMLTRLLAIPIGGAFNIATGQPRTVRSVLEKLADRLAAADCLRFGELPMRPEEPLVLFADMRKAREHIGFSNFTPMETALENLIAGWNGGAPTDPGRGAR